MTMANEAAKRFKADVKVTDTKKEEDDEDEDSNDVNAAELEYLSQWNETNDSDDEVTCYFSFLYAYYYYWVVSCIKYFLLFSNAVFIEFSG